MRVCPKCGARFIHDEAFCPNDGASTEEPRESNAPADPLIGTVVDGRYKIESQLGEGGMGVVYFATHTVLNKKLALKVLRKEMASDKNVVDRFIQEAQAATSIGHENIIDISDFGRLPDGAVYFAMEYLEGDPLTDLITNGGSIPSATAIDIIRQIASALKAAHDRGIVHRDLKPDNVVLIPHAGKEYFAKVLDFGIAKVGNSSNKLTQTGMIFGTPHYMAPEQAAGQSVDSRTDIYALGVIMYEMFTGRVPFDADTFMAVLTKHMFEEPVPPSQVINNPQLGALEDIILKALAKKTEDRYQSMQAVLDDLERFEAGAPMDFSLGGGEGGVAGLADALEPPSKTEMGLGRAGVSKLLASPKHKAILGAAALGLLLLVGVSVAALGGDDPEETATVEQAVVPPPPAAPPPVVEPDPEPEKAERPEIRFVELASTPTGAEVFIDGAFHAKTPTKVARAQSGAVVVEMRLPGYTSRRVRIGAATPDEMSVELREEEKKVVRRRPPRRKPAAKPATTPTKKPKPSGFGDQLGNDLMDPW